MDIRSLVNVNKINPDLSEVTPGDTVKVHFKVVEGGKERAQNFQGVVIGTKRGGGGTSFTVRRISYGVGVERTFFYSSPLLEKIEVLRHGKVRRAKLYYLRQLSTKRARLKEKRHLKVVPEVTQAEEQGSAP